MLRRISLLLLVAAAGGVLRAADLDGSPPATGAAEAVRLYARANDFVSGMREGQYSYGYLQFYWKRAESNVDRVERVYPDSPTARALKSGELKLGPYSLDYFRDRVLYNLEKKRLGSLDQVNCPIFLYGLDPKRSDAARDAAMESIIETLSRQQRWGEALIFPVLGSKRLLLLGTVFKVAARYDQDAVMKRMFASVNPLQQGAAGFWTSLAEADVYLGKPRAELDRLFAAHPGDDVKLAALSAMARREALIGRMRTLRLAIHETIATTHFQLANLSVRDDVEATAPRYFPGHPEMGAPALAVYRASQGQKPAVDASAEAHVAYLRALADAGRLDVADAYAESAALAPETRIACRRAMIEFYAEAGQIADADRRRAALAREGKAGADQAALAEFRGRLDSIDDPITVREKTFANLPIQDPCVLAVAIGEWALSPSQSIRGAAPWDAVVYRFAGGFEHLPPPASKDVSKAASELLPY